MNAITQAVHARAQRFTGANKSVDGGFSAPSQRGYAVPLTKDILGYRTADSLLMDNEVDEGRMCAKFVVSTINQDRQGDIVLPESCLPLLANYRANPVIFLDHHLVFNLPIASSESPEGAFCFWPEPESGRIMAQAWFHGRTPESTIVFGLVAAKQLRAASLGFSPVEGRRIVRRKGTEGENKYPAISPQGIQFFVIDVIEWSVVGVPANSEAIAVGLSKGLLFGERVSPVLHKALAAYAVPRSGAVRGGYDPKKGTQMKNIQAVVLFKKTFPSVAEAGAYAKAHNLDQSDMEERPDAWIYHQIPAERCKGLSENAGTAGVGHVTYKTAEGMAPEADVVAVPEGVKYLQAGKGMLDECNALLAEHNGMIEHPEVKAFHCKSMEEVGNLSTQMGSFAKSAYPDIEMGMDNEEADDSAKSFAYLQARKTLRKTIRKTIDDAAMGGVGTESAPPQAGAKFLKAAADCCDKVHEWHTKAMASQEHPPVVELAQAVDAELPVRREAIGKMMKEHYADYHKALGWGKKKSADDKKPEVAAEKTPGETKTKALETPAPEKSAQPGGADETMAELKEFVSGLMKSCAALAKKMGIGELPVDTKNPYEQPAGMNNKSLEEEETKKKAKALEDEEAKKKAKALEEEETKKKAMEDEEEQKALSEIAKGLAEIKQVTDTQARQLSYMTGGRNRH